MIHLRPDSFQWKVIRLENGIHVYPIHDLLEHNSQTWCECCPRVNYVNGEMMIIHNAYDKRERYEHFRKN